MNSAVCMACGDLIHSQHVHDYKQCFCKAITIDGGNEYCQYGGATCLIYPICNEYKYNEWKKLSRHERRDKIHKDNSIYKDWKTISLVRSCIMNTLEEIIVIDKWIS